MASLPSRQDFTGKVAFVAGGASGIGRATADVLASRGAFVSVIDRELSAASVAAEEISRLYGVKAVGLACDVSDYTQVDSAVHETVKLLGRLDCAVNAAAIPGAHRVTGEYPIDHWRKLSGVNLDGVFFCVKAQLNHFVRSGTQGAIVNVSSIHGFLAKTGDPAYVASKHAVIGLTKSAALEYGKHGIRVNAICPGFVKTPFIITSGGSMEQFEKAGSVAPLGRCGTADEIGRSIAFLLSDDASFVTGSVLTADGGYTLSGHIWSG